MRTGAIDWDHFARWLDGMPANGRYCFTSNSDCPIAQYLKAYGYTRVHVLTQVAYGTDRAGQRVEFDIDTVVSYRLADGPATYAHAREGLEKVLPRLRATMPRTGAP